MPACRTDLPNYVFVHQQNTVKRIFGGIDPIKRHTTPPLAWEGYSIVALPVFITPANSIFFISTHPFFDDTQVHNSNACVKIIS